MNKVEFFLEGIEDKPVQSDYQVPTEVIIANSVQEACKKLAKKHKMKLIDTETLLNSPDYRSYFLNNKKKTYIFYVKTVS
ncbi:hypothetical protein [Bacillus taeanensis]|uniref:Uncharacterized protein n=1 Tax=Bacillus taeanensis TaxID=273032 RepID=A0A366XT26_9BACI|nr:hypothetical protein [Bacillus taeanensis]RBW67313.1 hypothetical protein DS031_22885 [Bacillus taeanensis]